MNRVVHFEIHADDLDRAERFYTQGFGWTVQRWDGPIDYRLITTGTDGPGIDGALMKREGPSPVPGAPLNAFACTVSVDDLDTVAKALLDAGGTQVVERMAVPGVGYTAYFHDTEGNVVGIFQDDPSAA